MRDLRLS